MLDVVAPGFQVGVVHLIEHCDQGVALAYQCDLGVAALLADAGDHRIGERAVLDHQQMGVDEGRDFGRRSGRNLRPDLTQLFLGPALGAVEAGDLVINLRCRNAAFRDFQIGALHLLHAADGHAA